MLDVDLEMTSKLKNKISGDLPCYILQKKGHLIYFGVDSSIMV